MLQGVFAAVGDISLFLFAKREFGIASARWTLVSSLLSWFMFDVMVRTYSNSLETVFFQIFLLCWPSSEQENPQSRRFALLVAALAVIIRPTSAILWLWYGSIYLIRTKNRLEFLSEVLAIGVLSLLASALVDHWFYGRWVFPPLEFIVFNFFQSGSAIYGTHPWHWYFSNAIPTVTTSLMILLGVFVFYFVTYPGYRSAFWALLAPALFYTAVLSANGHKEFRFLLPVLPLLLVACGLVLRDLREKLVREQKQSAWKLLLLVVFLPQILMGVYFATIHQRGTTDVMYYIHNEAPKNSTVIFLMPCHSTPYHAYAHREDLKLRFLDCSPNITHPMSIDEADRFYAKPAQSLELLVASGTRPILIAFDVLIPSIQFWLSQHAYQRAASVFHAHIHEGRVGGSVVVYLPLDQAR